MQVQGGAVEVGRLIDADARIDSIRSFHCADCDRRKGTKNGKVVFCYQIGDAPCRACGIGDAIEYFEDAPTVDAAQVVLCKDCKHGKHMFDSFGRLYVECYNPYIQSIWYRNLTDYCSDGKKEEDGGEKDE